MEKNVDANPLFPVFFRTDKVKILIVGGGAVGTEKVSAILKHCPDARIRVVAPEIREEILDLKKKHEGLDLVYKLYDRSDLLSFNLVISATCFTELNAQVQKDCNEASILCNIADTPERCDFYMCSVVTKGDLKIAISTNGKSPTMAKRIREWMEDLLPASLQQVLDNLHQLREKMKGDFESKVQQLDALTEVMKKRDE
ncbi:MAG: bifunctional precorrin-2 dehydrogenase/sirohydrochlorin ferrochelatase [Cytophagaceae bacterium]|jgi:precorrin-2 dehydrogenase/sirohydrochlorin ferrochelatase|nr:bifunctional precorrin-2 dehydrogenase/sirohydrochlorin ferrochelatase [Cytophagaceae bacterium]